MAALALALLAGLRGVQYGRRTAFVLPVAWLLGMLCGLNAAATAGGALGAAVSLACARGSRRRRHQALAPVADGARRLGRSRAWLPERQRHGAFGVVDPCCARVASAVFVLVALVAAFVAALRAQWARIAVRVGGSWIAASGLLMLGWSMRGG